MLDKDFLEFISSIEKARNELGCDWGAFYRGHSQANHCLVPALLRGANDFALEHNFFVESFVRGQEYMRYKNNSWEFLSMMQHFGIPTRLLDWSECLATALFFALSAKDPEPHIWVLNPFGLNAANTRIGKRIFTIGLDRNIPDYESCFVAVKDGSKWPYKKPIFLQIPWSDKRMKNQKGFFTVHTDSIPLEKNCSKFLRKVILKKQAIAGAKRFLEYAGVSDETMFPDLDGLGRFIRKRYTY